MIQTRHAGLSCKTIISIPGNTNIKTCDSMCDKNVTTTLQGTPLLQIHDSLMLSFHSHLALKPVFCTQFVFFICKVSQIFSYLQKRKRWELIGHDKSWSAILLMSYLNENNLQILEWKRLSIITGCAQPIYTCTIWNDQTCNYCILALT